MKYIVALFLLSATAHAEVIENVNLGKLNHYKITYKIDLNKDLQECKETWHAGHGTNQPPHCVVWFSKQAELGKDGLEFKKEVELGGVTASLRASWEGLFIKVDGVGSSEFEANKEYILKALALAENGQYEAGVFMQSFQSNDPHIVSVADGNNVAAVERQFPDLDLSTCEENWTVTSGGYQSCSINHFEDMNNMESLNYDRWSVDLFDGGRLFSLTVMAYKNDYSVSISPRWGSEQLPADFKYFKPYIKEALNNAKDAGIDFKVMVMTPQADHQAQPDQSAPFSIDVVKQSYKFRMAECAQAWRGYNSDWYVEGKCEIAFESPVKNVHELWYDQKEYDDEKNGLSETVYFDHNTWGPNDDANPNVFTVAVDAQGDYTDFLFDKAQPIIQRALEALGTDVFDKIFYTKGE